MSVAFGRNSQTLVNAARVHDDGVYCSANPSLNIPPMPVCGNAASYLPIFGHAAPPPGLSPNQQFSYAFWAWIWIVWEATARPPQWMLLHSIVSRSVTIDEYHHAAREAQWGQAVEILSRGAKHVLMLSGTPWRTQGTIALLEKELEFHQSYFPIHQ